MSLESSLRECGAGLGSLRATERKKNAESLKSFLNGNHIPSVLSENTIQNKGYTWNDLFDDITELVLKETEKYESSKTFDSVMGPLCTNLIHLCVSGSNKGQAYIKCEKVIDACLIILRDNRLMKAVGDGYLNLLYKHVLTYDHYLSQITPAAWEDLLDVCLYVCTLKHSRLDNYTKLRLLLLVMKNGSNYCQLVIPLRNSLQRLKEVLHLNVDKKVQEVIVEIIIVLLKSLSTESRLTMCEFTESMLSLIMKFYDQNLDQKKKYLLFKLLRMMVNLHHPLGRNQYEKGSLAHDWDVWNKYLHSMLEVVCLEVTYLQKQRKQENFQKYYAEYYDLAASVYFQVFHLLSLNTVQEEGESSSKKQRVAFNKNKTFSDLVEALQQNHMPWLAIIDVYVDKNGHSVSCDEYLLLLSVLETLITASTNLNWNAFERLCCLVIRNLQPHFNNSNEVRNVVLSLWKSGLRTSTLVNASHKALHAVMQIIITFEILSFQNVQPLLKMYFEKGMPVTDHSLTTLNYLFSKFHGKCSRSDQKNALFNWLIQGRITALQVSYVKLFLRKLLPVEKIGLEKLKAKHNNLNHYDVLFNLTEKSMLFSEFELDVFDPVLSEDRTLERLELDIVLKKEIEEFFEKCISEFNDTVNKEEKLLDYINLLAIVIDYYDVLLKFYLITRNEIENEKLFRMLRVCIENCYFALINKLNNVNARLSDQIKLLGHVKDILTFDYDTILCKEARRIPGELFKCLNVIINRKINIDDVIYEEDESEMDPQALRHNCICLLAAYCRKCTTVRGEILDFILDPKIYNFTTSWDTNCALDCIQLLNDDEVEDSPLDSIFFLMQGMCRDLFKNPEATLKLLQIFLKLLDKFWQLENGKQNCCIMIRGYLKRCEKRHYPPKVAAMIYECASKIAAMHLRDAGEVDNTFLEAVQNRTKDDIHAIRLYCCYLFKFFVAHLSNYKITDFLSSLEEIFLIQVTDRHETIIKDESVNRTVTILHNYMALVQLKKSLLPEVVTEVMRIQKEKSLDKVLVKKVIDKVTNNIIGKSVETYCNENTLSIVNYWFSKGNTLENLPLYLFGYKRVEKFLEKHLKWLIPADVLWRNGGIVENSDVLKLTQARSGKSIESIVEACICHFIVLCLPYFVVNKYDLNYKPNGKKEWSVNSLKMFESTRKILGADKWSALFADNLSQLIISIATHFKDPTGAGIRYQVKIPAQIKSYQYPKMVFDAILVHMGELIEENILKYLCEDQAVAIFKVLFELWESVLQEKVFEYKVLNLHSYVTFVETIPLEQPTDAFVCNYACTSLITAIKDCQHKEEVKAYVASLKIILEKILPAKVEFVKKSLLQLLSILMIKKEENFEVECLPLFNYLTCDMKEFLKESEDVVDFITSSSQGSVFSFRCSSSSEFLERLKSYNNSLSCPSRETLVNLNTFLKNNKKFVSKLSEELNSKGFSDDCGRSAIHQIIYSLTNTLKSATDDKTITEACNCLSEIGNYDLKTLVMVPPSDTQRVMNIPPKQFFALVVMTSLTDVLFNETPAVTKSVTKALKQLLLYREGKLALDIEEVNKEFLMPFTTADSNHYAEFKIKEAKFTVLTSSNFWIPKEGECNEQWLNRTTAAVMEILIAKENYLASLHGVCVSKPKLCRNILSPLVSLLLDCSSENHIKLIAESINNFFKYVWDLNFDNRFENSEDSVDKTSIINVLDHKQKMIVHYMLDVVNFVRLQRNHYKKRTERTIESLNYLKLDYDKVAWAATLADQNLAAIYYGELWAIAQNNGVPPASPETTTQLSGGENIQRILRKCFVSIGEMNAIDGCGTAHLTSEDEKRRHLMNTGQFADAMLLHDIALSCDTQGEPQLQLGIVKSLYKSGMHHLALQYIKSLPENENLNDVKFECLSYLGDWSDFVDTRELEDKSKKTSCNPYSVLKAYRYSCLKDCLNIKKTTDFECKLITPLNRAKRAVASLCVDLNMDNCQNVYKVLSRIHMFSDIEDYFEVRCDKLPLNVLLARWQVKELPSYNNFKHLEALISQRSLVLQHAAKEYQGSLQEIVSLQVQYAELSLSNERVQMAQRLMAMVKKVHTSQNLALTDSQISWAKGHKDIALSLLRNIVSKPDPDVRLTAVSLRQYGLWMAESKRDNARDIINKYLKKSLEVLGDYGHEEIRLKVYYDIAKFADTEYKQVVAYMNSSVFEKKLKCLETMKGTADSLRGTQGLSKDERKALNVSDRFGQIDEAEIASTKAEKETFLQLAMKYYLLSLKESDANNLSVFRMISLWLDNPSIQLTENATKFENMMAAIPSRKFIAVLPQLAPRLTNEKCLFADHLRKILKRCAIEHPHHTLPILFSLKNSHKDNMILNASENVGRPSQRNRQREPRVTAAEALVHQLSTENSALAKIIEQMEKLCDATISFANYLPKTKEMRQEIPAAERIHRLGPLDAVPIPTVTIPIRNDCNYSFVPTIHSFEKYFELVGGINCPKKITCKSSGGEIKILLIKGEDDLRQDAVMQQVFNIVNTLLGNDPVTSRNKLLIRTYKVVPMSRRSGVLEWCEGTMPIGTWLVGPTGAHARYRPTDISAVAARKWLTTYHQERKSNEEKLALYIRILKEFKPVFHYFFTEHYLDPVTWYERRLAYTKSVASSSMVGYILGLGDRHLQNILIDKNTAEVVHIDFGIAFDQGKTLPTPETIPFRLTQDIVAGFGSSGVEGIFRRSCEKTMQLLRDNQETLLTILEVLLCDPLYSWTVTSKQQNVLTAPSRDTNGNQSSSEGSLAKRALLSVSSKLSGTEGGLAGGVAVPGQVARLIHAAVDRANLSRLYPGWQPFL